MTNHTQTTAPRDAHPGYVWGIDPAVSRLAFAFADLDGEQVEVETLCTATDTTEGERLGLLDRQVRIYARQQVETYPPAVVWVEQPSGRWRNLPLAYAVGVVQAALFETLHCPVWTIPSSAWKRRTVGAGNATKPQVMAWAERVAVVGNQDEADAVGIAWAGRAMVASGQWETAA
jgi:Holliday junction resolvasome RuvABC endonuclease subunit